MAINMLNLSSCNHHVGLAQLVSGASLNPEVVGSTPGVSNFVKLFFLLHGQKKLRRNYEKLRRKQVSTQFIIPSLGRPHNQLAYVRNMAHPKQVLVPASITPPWTAKARGAKRHSYRRSAKISNKRESCSRSDPSTILADFDPSEAKSIMRAGLFAHNEASQDKLQNLPDLCLNGRAVKDLHKTRSPLNKTTKKKYLRCGLQHHTTLQ
jgi:hypothetical protein